MTYLIKDFLTDFQLYRNDPTEVAPRVYEMITAVQNGEVDIVDPTTPFAGAVESAVVIGCGAVEKFDRCVELMFPRLANTPSDLFAHMSDRDYMGRFAKPAITQFSLFIPKDECIEKMVYDQTTDSSKLVIPRNTYFTVAETIFSLQYPIVISRASHGAFSIVYDTDKVSPLQTLETNVVDWAERNVGDEVWLILNFEVQQFSIISKRGDLNAAKEYSLDIPIDDYYYYARIYYQNSNGTWMEMKTTHSEQVYDIATPTAVLTVVDKNVNVRIPQVYTVTGTLKAKLRMDIYQTKGPIQMDLSAQTSGTFGATWENYDKADDTIFVAPVKTFRSIIPMSDSFVVGGALPLSFEVLRERLITRTNAIDKVLPITNVQLESTLEDIGYEVVRDVDMTTNRIFLATKPMPDPTDTKLITAAASSMETLSIKMADAALIGTVIDNGTSITITPQTLYRNVGGVVSIVPDEQVASLLALPPDKRALAVSGAGYCYSPFHYVLDSTGTEFKMRPYYLDNPSVLVKNFIEDNDTTQLQVATQSYGVFKMDTGYAIRIVTSSTDAYKALSDDVVQAQLAFVPDQERDRAYINGIYVGRDENGERIFDFDLSSTMNVNSNAMLELTKFLMYTNEPRIVGAPLDTTFDIFHTTSAVMDSIWAPKDMDTKLGRFMLPSRIAAISHETLKVHFGDSLDTLWARARTVAMAAPYKRWDVNVPMLYEKDIYETDPITNSPVQIVDGEVKLVVKYYKGDTVLNADGEPILKYAIGDVMVDNNGNPIPLGERSLSRQVDIMLLEGVYWFATDAAAAQYRSDMVKIMLQWLVGDLGDMTSRLLDNTKIYYFPKATQGLIRIASLGTDSITVSAGQSFNVSLQMAKGVVENEDLKKRLLEITIRIISDALKETTISMSDVNAKLREEYRGDVIGFSVTGLGGSANYSTLTVLDGVNRLSLRKRLEAQADGSLVVKEDVVMTYEWYKQNPLEIV